MKIESISLVTVFFNPGKIIQTEEGHLIDRIIR